MTDKLYQILIEFWDILAEMAPYLLFGFAIAGVLSIFLSSDWIQRHLGGRGFGPIFKASLFGVPLPLCSCGVIPVSMSLNQHGASKAATVSFLLSTPQTGIDSILVTYSLLGPVFAVFRPIIAFATGLFGGQMVTIFDPQKETEMAAKDPGCKDSCCDSNNKTPKWLKAFRHGFITLPADIGKSMLIGLLLAGLISVLIPDDFFSVYLAAGGGLLAMIVMLFVGIPIYVCATASVPIAAVMIGKGLSPGAALVFLMTGPATNAAAFTTLWAKLGKRSAIIYLFSVVVCALAAGVAMDYLVFQADWASVKTAGHSMLPEWFRSVCAILLLIVLGAGIAKKQGWLSSGNTSHK